MGMLVFLIVPGIGFLYGGMARRKSALAMIFQSMTVMAVCTFQFMFWGFSIGFSRTGGPFIGDLSMFGMRNVMAAPSSGSVLIPDIVFAFYELMFCACATMIVVGGSFERGRIVPSIIFGFCWATVVYCPVAYWTWNANGWLFKLPSLDFAGGGPVHITSGVSSLAYALILGKRLNHGEKAMHKPHNVTIVFLGTVLIWFGWFGFNGGSALNASMRSMVAVWNTNCAACTGVLGSVLFRYVKKRKFSVIGACEGAIAGLVGVTPAAGYVDPWCAAAIGFITALVIASLEGIQERIGVDDGLEVFKLHGIGGMMGSFLTGIFATQAISSLDGGSRFPGGIDGNAIQVGKQFAEITSISLWSFGCTSVLLLAMKYIPGLHLRVQDEAEMIGYDLDQFDDEVVGEWSLFENESPHLMGRAATEESSSLPEKVTKIQEEASVKV
jgi:Amt family ammonium transporter